MNQALTWSRREVWVRKLLYPGHTLPTAAAPVAVATGLAIHDHVFMLLPAVAALLAGWLIHVGGVLTDNYVNLVQQPEDREHPELVTALKVGTLAMTDLRAAIVACYALAVLTGMYLLQQAGPGVLVIGVAGIAASWAYSTGPWPVGKHGLADPLFFAFFGVVSVVGAYYVQAATAHGTGWSALLADDALPLAAFALGVPIGALTTNILIVDDIRDREFDAVKGKRTIAVRFGAARSRIEFTVLLAVACLAPLAFWQILRFSPWILLPLVTVPHAVSIARAVWTRDRFEDLVPMTPRAGRLLLAYAVLLAAGAAVPSPS